MIFSRLKLCRYVVATALTACASAASAADVAFGKAGAAFVNKHCVACHGEKQRKADLALHLDRDDLAVLNNRKRWESALEMVESGEMPPAKQPKPSPAEIEAFVSSVRRVFENAARSAKLDPGKVTIRRLNRLEYNNTIRDLVGVDFQPAEDFPSDDVGHGFDNIGDVLSLSPVLMERYLAAAETIVARAIMPEPLPAPKRRQSTRYVEPSSQKLEMAKNYRIVSQTRDKQVEATPVQSGPLHMSYRMNEDGEYKFKVKLYAKPGVKAADSADDLLDGKKEIKAPVRVSLLVCGKKLAEPASDDEVAKLAGAALKNIRPLRILKTVEVKATEEKNAEVFETQISGLAGVERVALAVHKSADGESSPEVMVEYFEVEGPLDTRPSSHRKLLTCNGEKPVAEQSREVLTRFASRAYRRPATKDEVDRLVKLADGVIAEGGRWEAGMQFAMSAALVSPKFLFRVELDNRPDSPQPHPIDEFQLACRLSYFLWGSMPDLELFTLAHQNQLTASLEPQVRRMLKDPKAAALVDSFAMQWLQLQRLKSIAPDAKIFPSFNEILRDAMLKETSLFVQEIVREDRSILDLIQADFTYLNEPLAKHYAIADTTGNRMYQKPTQKPGEPIRGNEFMRVSLHDSDRGGLLTQASILAVTSNPTRTSPVKRGRWVLEQILGTPPPPPPPNVPELKEDDKTVLTGSLRQRMEQHRANPSCASCHARMDPLGFAFENYDAIGRFRTKDGEFSIEPGGVLPDGSSFQGPQELKGILKEKKELFARSLTEKLLTYALGRGLEYYDERAIDRIQATLAKDDYRFSTLVIEIAKSDPFRLRRGKDSAP